MVANVWSHLIKYLLNPSLCWEVHMRTEACQTKTKAEPAYIVTPLLKNTPWKPLLVYSFSLLFVQHENRFFFSNLLLLYILQQAVGVKVSNKFFLQWCFLVPEITYNVHFLCIILWRYLVELKIDLKLSLLGAGNWKERKENMMFF